MPVKVEQINEYLFSDTVYGHLSMHLTSHEYDIRTADGHYIDARFSIAMDDTLWNNVRQKHEASSPH